jgi:hypothetical protein
LFHSNLKGRTIKIKTVTNPLKDILFIVSNNFIGFNFWENSKIENKCGLPSWEFA